jgi:hypothetical protein
VASALLPLAMALISYFRGFYRYLKSFLLRRQAFGVYAFIYGMLPLLLLLWYSCFAALVRLLLVEYKKGSFQRSPYGKIAAKRLDNEY